MSTYGNYGLENVWKLTLSQVKELEKAKFLRETRKLAFVLPYLRVVTQGNKAEYSRALDKLKNVSLGEESEFEEYISEAKLESFGVGIVKEKK